MMCSSIVKKDPPSKPPTSTDGAPAPILGMVENCNSTKGISIAVIDANAIIEGRQNLTNLAQKLETVPEVVLSEILDSTSCSRLDLMPFPIETMEPSVKSISKVEKFAEATGDRRALSVVDVKLIALAYELEVHVNGTKNLRDVPPPIQKVRVERLPDKELPGWGSNEQEGERKQRRYPPKKTEVKLEGKMVVEGIDASQGQCDDGDWRPAVSSSTHRNFLRRKAKWEHYNALAQQDIQRDLEAGNLTQQDTIHQMSDENCAKVIGENDEEEEDSSIGEDDSEVEAEGIDEASSMADDASSEQSWPLRALSESSVACITADYAMQNVILQMGLRLLAPGGMQIRQLNRWIMRCHACYTMVTDPNPCKIIDWCPKCGNLGTLRQVAVTIGENGTTIAAHKQRFSLRGTKFSIPMPTSGRDAITKNLVLREDQLPQNYLHPKTKKKASKLGDEYFISDDVFMNPYSDRKAPLQPPVRKTMAIFNQKRNPNDNHYSRSMH